MAHVAFPDAATPAAAQPGIGVLPSKNSTTGRPVNVTGVVASVSVTWATSLYGEPTSGVVASVTLSAVDVVADFTFTDSGPDVLGWLAESPE